MKSFVFLSLSFFLLAISTFSADVPVLDGYNLQVLSGTKYLAISSLMDGGGISTSGQYVIQSANFQEFGKPVVFSHNFPEPRFNKYTIFENTPVNIKFYGDKTIWKVEGYPGTDGPYYISTNGIKGESDISTWFQIRLFNYYSFQIEFCPEGTGDCYVVGHEDVGGERRLVLKKGFTNFSHVYMLAVGGGIPLGGTTTLSPDDVPVLDSYNLQLLSDTKYLPVASLMDGGGVSPSGQYVIQSSSFQEFGKPVVFSHNFPQPRLGKYNILESTPVNIKFYGDKTLWKVEGYPGTGGPYYISTTGIEGEPDISTWFQMRLYNYYSYQIEFCPEGKDSCQVVGYEDVGGQRRLVLKTGLTNFPCVFMQADGGGIPLPLGGESIASM